MRSIRLSEFIARIYKSRERATQTTKLNPCMRTCRSYRALLIATFALAAAAGGELPKQSSDAQEVAALIERFHAALASGDAKAAMNLLATDAVILESGFAESRADYEREHLPEDIKFAQQVHTARSEIHVEINADTAWLTSHSKSEGTFEGKAVDSSGVELAVLTRTPDGWRIRAIHWSSHKSRSN